MEKIQEPQTFNQKIHFRKATPGMKFWHGKLFTVEWSMPHCKWVLIRHVNGNRKYWYKRTERPYRFRRWFIRKGVGRFSNLANIDFPYVVFYVFRWYFPWPKRVVLQMDVRRLTTTIPRSMVIRPRIKYYLCTRPLKLIAPDSEFNSPQLSTPALHIFSFQTVTAPTPVYNFPLLDNTSMEIIRKEIIKEDQTMSLPPNKTDKSHLYA